MKKILTLITVFLLVFQFQLFSQTETRIRATDSATNSLFGWDITKYNDYMLIGSLIDDNENGQNAGAAYVFWYDNMIDSWAQTYKIVPNDGHGQDRFGCSVSLAEDNALIGAWANDINGDQSGIAYIYERDNLEWVKHSLLIPEDGNTSDQFGENVCLSGNFAICGAQYDDDDGTNSGSAYFFKYDTANDSWDQFQKIKASDAAEQDRFGGAICLDGEYVILGAYFNDDSASNCGSAYIFHLDTATGYWSEHQKLLPSVTKKNLEFGWSVALKGGYAAVGTHFEDTVYVFKRNGNIWEEEQKIYLNEGGTTVIFGRALSIWDDILVVGSENYPTNDNPGQGAAFAFKRNSGTGQWEQESMLYASDGEFNDQFGTVVFVDSTGVFGGTPHSDGDMGTVYNYTSVVTRISESDFENSKSKLELNSVSPNPFSKSTTISFEIKKERQDVSLEIYNLTGQLICQLFTGELLPGTYEKTWGGRNNYGELMTADIYFVRLKSSQNSSLKKIVLKP